MRFTTGITLALACTLFQGCTAMRVFQTKVPSPVVKSQAAVENDRQAADLLAQKIATPVELIPVAQSLSASLGKPQHSLLDVKVFDLPKAAAQSDAALRSDLVNTQHRLDVLNKKLASLEGKSIEGTGISILGPGMGILVIGLIVLGVIFPPVFTLLAFAYRRLRATATMVVDQIDTASKAPETAAAVKAIKTELNGVMDAAHKKVIHALQTPST